MRSFRRAFSGEADKNAAEKPGAAADDKTNTPDHGESGDA